MITATTFPERGLVQVSGSTPNGPAVVERIVDGFPPYTLRGGNLNVALGGLVLEDSEAPLALPLKYQVSVSPIERQIQQNLVLTPTMLHGRQGWTPGVNRSLTVTADSTARSAMVAEVSPNPAGVAGASPPTVVGSVSSLATAPGSYTLTPPTTGGSAIANGDWMVWAHQQVASSAPPAVPAGWTLVADQKDQNLIRLTVWTRKRLAGDTSYALVADSAAASIGTLTWVRTAIDTQVVSAVVGRGGFVTNVLTTDRVTTIRPSVVLSIFAAQASGSTPLPVAGDLSGATWVSTASSIGANDPRTLVVGRTNAGAQLVPAVSLTYQAGLVAGMSLQIGLMVADTITNRVIARIPVAALPADPKPYLLAGRIKFISPGVDTWQDIKDIGTWQDVKTARANWLAVRGVNVAGDADYLRLFVTITNPTTGLDYIQPVQALGLSDAKVNIWQDFSVQFTLPTAIPAGAEIRLLHGTTLIEYGITWYLDQVGVTAPPDMAHLFLYWFDGDSSVPPDPQNYRQNEMTRWPLEEWVDLAGDSSIRWSGAVGNSVSVFTGPSRIRNVAETILQPPKIHPSEPVLLSDPVDSSFAAWASLQPYDDLIYPAHSQAHEVLDRPDPLATARIRGWATGTLSVLTRTFVERAQVLTVLTSGRPILLRTPYREYPENDWYLSLDNLSESRPLPNQRLSVRVFTADYMRIGRPDGLIAVSAGAKWSDVKAIGTWEDVRDERDNWLDVILTVPGVA